jgi:hypothetical protein
MMETSSPLCIGLGSVSHNKGANSASYGLGQTKWQSASYSFGVYVILSGLEPKPRLARKHSR